MEIWMSHVSKNLLSRVRGSNTPALHDKGLATAIGTIDKDAGKGLDTTMHLLVESLGRWGSRVQSWSSTVKILRAATLQFSFF